MYVGESRSSLYGKLGYRISENQFHYRGQQLRSSVNRDNYFIILTDNEKSTILHVQVQFIFDTAKRLQYMYRHPTR